MKKTATKTEPATPTTIPDGRYFSITRKSFSEATLTEVLVKDGQATEIHTDDDVSRIQLGKMLRRIQDTYSEHLK